MNKINATVRTDRGIEMQNRKEPELMREQFPYSEVPRILFDNKTVPLDPADEIWITDTTFRDGQQARPPYTPDQIAHLYDLMNKLGGPKGIIRQSEFFLYSDRDKKAVEKCLAQGHSFPEVTGWIRANENDLQLVQDMGLKETGILTSVSDYHIYLKLKKDRTKMMEHYLRIVKSALDKGIRIRCHFEDVTRADIYGFCLPLAEELLKLSEESGIPVKIRLCDTMGYGLSYPGTILPRSIPKLIHAFRRELGYPSHLLEWHGHNDFHKAHINGTTAWLYGVSALNATLLGYGERTGNPPMESAVMEYIGLRGTADGMDTRVISEIAEYYEGEIKASIPANYPFVGEDFNTTRAGIHADGLLKNPEIYNIFDTGKILNRPIRVTVTDKSGYAGIARWLNENIPLIKDGTLEPINKRHPGIKYIHDWVMEQYARGRTTGISPEELIAQAKHYIPSLFKSEFQQVKEEARAIARHISEGVSSAPEIQSLDRERMEPILDKIIKREKSIQLLAITDSEGRRISQVHTQRGEKNLFRNLMNKDFRQHQWFVEVVGSGSVYCSELFFSKYTGALVFTIALPIYNQQGEIYAVMDIDFKFDELVKLITPISEEILESH
ncbi:MAG TPA: histone-lysine N-methyltransferase [Sediminispirochaeta sp.]|nr:histone-lysine N-methyltransferase [Sediminispirochaeta sp.]